MTGLFEMRIRVGGDPRGFREFSELRDELAKLSHPACPDIDWARVEQLCLTLFQQNGADLQTAVSYALACSQRAGVQGMVQGLALIETLCREWHQVWPPMAAVRLDILGWLFAQWQPLLRGQPVSMHLSLLLEHLDAELARFSAQLARQEPVALGSLHALRDQVSVLLQRLERSVDASQSLPQLIKVPQPAFIMPVVVLPAQPMTQVPPAPGGNGRRRFIFGLLGLAVITVFAGGAGWWSHTQGSAQAQATTVPIRLDSLSLFDAGSSALKPDATRLLIDALSSIKAQPGWRIMIVGHTDTTGEAQHNLQISYDRAVAVRQWMQRMSDLPDDCFDVLGAAGRQPIATNDTAAGRAANRRVDIQLVPQSGVCGGDAPSL